VINVCDMHEWLIDIQMYQLGDAICPVDCKSRHFAFVTC